MRQTLFPRNTAFAILVAVGYYVIGGFTCQISKIPSVRIKFVDCWWREREKGRRREKKERGRGRQEKRHLTTTNQIINFQMIPIRPPGRITTWAVYRSIYSTCRQKTDISSPNVSVEIGCRKEYNYKSWGEVTYGPSLKGGAPFPVWSWEQPSLFPKSMRRKMG